MPEPSYFEMLRVIEEMNNTTTLPEKESVMRLAKCARQLRENYDELAKLIIAFNPTVEQDSILQQLLLSLIEEQKNKA